MVEFDIKFDINSEGRPIVWIFQQREYKYTYEEICLRKDVAEALKKIWKENDPYLKDEDLSIFSQVVTTNEKILAHYTKANPNDKIEDIV